MGILVRCALGGWRHDGLDAVLVGGVKTSSRACVAEAAWTLREVGVHLIPDLALSPRTPARQVLGGPDAPSVSGAGSRPVRPLAENRSERTPAGPARLTTPGRRRLRPAPATIVTFTMRFASRPSSVPSRMRASGASVQDLDCRDGAPWSDLGDLDPLPLESSSMRVQGRRVSVRAPRGIL